MRQRLPGQAGNGRNACTQFRHRDIMTARHRATHRIYYGAVSAAPSDERRFWGRTCPSA